MAGVSYKVADAGPTASFTKNGKPKYQVPYIVTMSSLGDGPQRVADYLESENIYLGQPYRCGDDRDDFALCDGITPKKIAKSQKMTSSGPIVQWNVDVTYGPMEEDDKPQTVSGEFTDDPEQWRWQMSQGYSAWQEPCWKATNVDSFPHRDSVDPPAGAYTRLGGTEGPVVNSAGIVLDPTLMRDYYDRVWQITCFSLECDSDISDTYMGAINKDVIRYHDNLPRYYGLKQPAFGWLPYVVKCANASATNRIYTLGRLRLNYWEWSFEFRFRTQGRGWLEEVLDRGTTARAASGMDDGTGGQMGSEYGCTPARPITDAHNRRVSELVLLDGAGRAMEEGDDKEGDGYYFGWRKDPLQKFSDIPFKFFKT